MEPEQETPECPECGSYLDTDGTCLWCKYFSDFSYFSQEERQS